MRTSTLGVCAAICHPHSCSAVRRVTGCDLMVGKGILLAGCPVLVRRGSPGGAVLVRQRNQLQRRPRQESFRRDIWVRAGSRCRRNRVAGWFAIEMLFARSSPQHRPWTGWTSCRGKDSLFTQAHLRVEDGERRKGVTAESVRPAPRCGDQPRGL